MLDSKAVESLKKETEFRVDLDRTKSNDPEESGSIQPPIQCGTDCVKSVMNQVSNEVNASLDHHSLDTVYECNMTYCDPESCCSSHYDANVDYSEDYNY